MKFVMINSECREPERVFHANSLGNKSVMQTISGMGARALIESQLTAHGNGVHSILAQYRRDDAVTAWHETIRAVEEFINLPKFGISDDRLRAWLCAIRLDDAFVSNPMPTLLAVRQALAPHIEAPVIIATAPAAAAAKDSPIIAAAKKAATDAKR